MEIEQEQEGKKLADITGKDVNHLLALDRLFLFGPKDFVTGTPIRDKPSHVPSTAEASSLPQASNSSQCLFIVIRADKSLRNTQSSYVEKKKQWSLFLPGSCHVRHLLVRICRPTHDRYYISSDRSIGTLAKDHLEAESDDRDGSMPINHQFTPGSHDLGKKKIMWRIPGPTIPMHSTTRVHHLSQHVRYQRSPRPSCPCAWVKPIRQGSKVMRSEGSVHEDVHQLGNMHSNRQQKHCRRSALHRE